MAKKESVKRGYTTSEEVEGHLKKFNSDDQKITYLHRILYREKLISKGTSKAVCQKLGEAYEELFQREMNTEKSKYEGYGPISQL